MVYYNIIKINCYKGILNSKNILFIVYLDKYIKKKYVIYKKQVNFNHNNSYTHFICYYNIHNYNEIQSTSAQKSNTTSVGTFSAKGYTGQTFVLPTGIMFTPKPNSISQFNLLPSAGSIIAGNWRLCR